MTDRTGYEVTFHDFQRLVSDPYCLPLVTPLIRQWFSCEIVPDGGVTIIRDAMGATVDKEELHRRIQADPEMQGSLYRTSQTLWR